MRDNLLIHFGFGTSKSAGGVLPVHVDAPHSCRLGSSCLGVLVLGLGLFLSRGVLAQNSFSAGGVEYPIAGALAGDQTAPSVAISSSRGYLVWQENGLDGDGLGIRAERLDANLNKSGLPFRVNAQTVGDQEKPQVAMLADGGAVFVWQGGKQGYQEIYARILPATGTSFTSGDILVNTYTNDSQITPAVATLTNGNIVVVWGSFGQDGSLQGVFGQLLNPAGGKIGSEFRINAFTPNNQRAPAVAALSGGGFVVAWVTELQRDSTGSVDVFARLYDSNGNPVGAEFAVNTSTKNACAHPSVAASPDGGFAIAWSQQSAASGNASSSQFVVAGGGQQSQTSWDVYARILGSNGTPKTQPVLLNTFTYGDQYSPKISAFRQSYLASWLSLGQDGFMEGVFGQYFTSDGQLAGVEFQVNTGNASRQITPVIASDSANRFLVAWSSFATSANFDLFAREYDLIQLSISSGPSGAVLSWNTKPGLLYQVQTSTDSVNWSNYGTARTATGLTDSITLSGGVGASLFRVIGLN